MRQVTSYSSAMESGGWCVVGVCCFVIIGHHGGQQCGALQLRETDLILYLSETERWVVVVGV